MARIIVAPSKLRVIGVTHAIDIRCPGCKTASGVFCFVWGASPRMYCRARLDKAATITRENNARIRQQLKERHKK